MFLFPTLERLVQVVILELANILLEKYENSFMRTENLSLKKKLLLKFCLNKPLNNLALMSKIEILSNNK